MIIGISGKLGSGKDTVGKMIQIITDSPHLTDDAVVRWLDRDLNSTYENKKFADKLKDIVCLIINCTREQLEDRDFKHKRLGEDWDSYLTNGTLKPVGYYDDNRTDRAVAEKRFKQKMTPRLMLQLIGTEGGRNLIHPNIWVNSLMADYKSNSKWLITDMRFPNELKTVENRGGVTIRVNRDVKLKFPKLWKIYKSSNKFIAKLGVFLTWLLEHDRDLWEKLNHTSETALDNANFDIVINNEGTLEDLSKKVREVLQTRGLI